MPQSPTAPSKAAAALAHASVAVLFGLLAIAWSFPLARHLETHLPGEALGDNALFLWAFWWMRTALATGTTFFHTAWLFAPAGVDLTLHTHTALPAFVGATLLGSVPLVAALNLTIIASLALNAVCAYWMAWRVTGQHIASVTAGLIFGSSSYVAAHLNGHFNLTHAWTIPLFALAFLEAGRGSLAWGVAAGFVLGATAYIDYYYLVYECLVALLLLALTRRRWSIALGSGAPLTSAWSTLVLVTIVVHILLIAAVAATGGFGGPDWPFRLSVRDTFNPRQTLGALLALWLWLRYRPRVSVVPGETAGATWWPIVATLAVFVATASPLLLRGVSLALDGQYVSQPYFWRSAPRGIDLATLVLGPPFHGLVGESVRRFYGLFRIDTVESGAWLGVCPLLLAWYACRRHASDPSVRMWGAMGAVFFVWALGSHLFVLGQNTAFVMPGALLRFVPIASNARMPGRAIVVVSLALAMLAAIGVARYSTRRRHPAFVATCAAVVVCLELLPTPFPLVAAACPPIYRTLIGRPERGAVAGLPLAIGDGLGAVTAADHQALVCQTLHERPIVGGFVARLPPAVMAHFLADPLLAAWLRLSGARGAIEGSAPLPDRRAAGDLLEGSGVAFVMLHKSAASPDLRRYVEQVMPLAPIAEDGERTLYRVTLPVQ